MIFLTLGSQKFQFNRLLMKVDELIEHGVIDEEVYAQTGFSSYRPQHYKYQPFLSREKFSEMESKADTVITHGGTGAIMGAVKNNKKVIAVPRLSKFGEHVDDHQVQLLNQFAEMGIIESCYDVENLDEAYRKSKSTIYIAYTSSREQIIKSIDAYLRSEIGHVQQCERAKQRLH